MPYGYTTIGITAMGARARHRGFRRAAAPRKKTSATSAPVHACFTLIAPVTSSRWAVRGLRASISRSMIRFAAIANVRSPTIAIVTSSSLPQWTFLSHSNIAVSAAM